MKVTAFNGSPRKSGNTSMLIGLVVEEDCRISYKPKLAVHEPQSN